MTTRSIFIQLRNFFLVFRKNLKLFDVVGANIVRLIINKQINRGNKMSFDLAPLQNLIDQFERMQGIGHKTAQRMAFYVLGLSDEQAREFAQAITDAHTKSSNAKFVAISPMMICALFVRVKHEIKAQSALFKTLVTLPQ